MSSPSSFLRLLPRVPIIRYIRPIHTTTTTSSSYPSVSPSSYISSTINLKPAISIPSLTMSSATTTTTTNPASVVKKERIAVIGSGNWGSAIAKLCGENAARYPERFEQEVKMWVFHEEVQTEGEGGKMVTMALDQVINQKHENEKYLPGIKLPSNVVAFSDLVETVQDATALVFVMPHQFLNRTISTIRGKTPSATKAITLIKGVDVQGPNIHVYADMIQEELNVSCSSLSGANIADEVARNKFSETTVGFRNREEGELWQSLFQTRMFRVQLIDDVAGVSLCGALKNVVAVGAGLVDGLEWGNNAKAAIMRVGLLEMRNFCLEFFKDVKNQTFLEESAGVADLITSCLGGRNRRCAEAFARTGKPFDVLEKEMLGGQKLQGIHVAKDVHVFLKARGRLEAYPLFWAVYRIAWKEAKPEDLIKYL